MRDFDDILVVALEQAVAAPYASGLLAEAGARVIKIEREEGDFARNYDHVVHGESAYFVWLNRGKQSVCLDVKDTADRRVLFNMLARADVFIQNLRFGAVDGLGLDYDSVRAINPGIIMCSISGYGESGPYADMKAYDLLVQAESGLSSITGTADGLTRVGISVCDISTGLSAYAAILRALIRRGRTGTGTHIRLSLFEVMADWMNVPLLHRAYGGKQPACVGLNHPSIAPYGMYPTGDGKGVVISIQNEREWKVFCRGILQDETIAGDPRFDSIVNRVRHRPELDALIVDIFRRYTLNELCERLLEHQIAYGRVNLLEDVLTHPQRRTVTVDTPSGPVTLTAGGVLAGDEPPACLPVPALGQHTAQIRAEFGEG